MQISEIERRVKAAAESKAEYLTKPDLALIFDYVDHAEPAMAFELLCSQLYEHEWPATASEFLELRELAELMSVKMRALELWERKLNLQVD